jgi:FKBP-type peptidyl-prolyl cis-trans isomerase
MGKGTVPSPSSKILVTYKGSLMDGTVFDQSKAPVEWPLNRMIQGWQIGFTFLPKGTSATLYIPSTLGYGQNGYHPDIPPNANLIFEVELLDVKN